MDTKNITYQYNRLNIAEKLIVINVFIFIAAGLLKILFGWSGATITQWFELPKDFFQFLTQPWSIVTYSFFHSGFGHVFWNMIMLYFSGKIFLNLFDNKRFINVYFLGVILGGLIFLLSYNIFPALLGINTSLIGASAGVTAVLIFVCTYLPNQEVRVVFFNVKLWHIGVFVVALDLIQISYGGNVGGRLAHLGGAALGYYYARQLFKGHDIGSGFSKFLGYMEELFKRKDKKAPLKTVYRRESSGAKSKEFYDKESHQRKIDAILDKISKSGYESLSKAEKDFLFKAGKE
ncbi:Membrane associated serine protease, rhomboid family [Arenibacter nanhaiticus]|uniref:Membrane associated serine protease, rhomboid family n=1 Tax=Arenibacter nanhaiticus TaxID=558155 RepID=A0A1M6J363_9FLAO|nr:rhomboid family intramembrane serine protease [Arenibacter nanhaiticus]SHJ41154.1 Membrane associated serine protease, rhomboid family [Arenibacter nanhaiticus]